MRDRCTIRTPCPFARSPRDMLAFCLAMLLCAACCTGWSAPADGGGAERAVKAASIYRFLGYVEWPPSASAFSQPDTPLVIGVAGADELAEELIRVTAGRTANGHPIQVRRLRPGDSLADLHVLFIDRSSAEAQSQLLRAASARPILTITDTEGALALGSMINFRFVDGRVRFEVSLGAVEKNGLKISSRMLQVALAVHAEVPQ